MSDYIDPHFVKALCCEPEKRTLQELQIIYYGLHALEPLTAYRDSILRALCKLVRYEKHQVNEVLFYTGELAQCWYILLSGAVFIGGSMFLPGSSFGKRNGGSVRRPSECFVLETSEMIVIDYPEVSQSSNLINHLQQYPISPSVTGAGCPSVGSGCGIIGLPTQNIILATSNNNSSNSGSNYFSCNINITNNNNNNTNSRGDNSGQTDSSNIVGNSGIEYQPSSSSSSAVVPSLQQQQQQTSPVGGLGAVSTTSESGIVNNSSAYQPNTPKSPSGVASIHSSSVGSVGGGGSQLTSAGEAGATNINGCINGGLPNFYQQRNCSTGSIGSLSGQQLTANNYRQQPLTNTNSCFNQKTMEHYHLRHTAGFSSNRPELYQKCNRGSHSSDTSSAYSGSDTMTSVHSSSLDADEVDLSGLVESVVDSDEEDLAESVDSLNVRDAVRDCLEKDPSDRTEDDIETLLDFTQTLKAFTNMTLAVRRALCSVMVFAVVDKAGTMVMSDGEELDSWSVLINGHVEIEHSNGEKEELQVGDSFGILPTMDKLYHRGVMRTKCDDCQFVCITQTDYYRIQHQGEENTKRHEVDGHVVMVTELRHSGGNDITALLPGGNNMLTPGSGASSGGSQISGASVHGGVLSSSSMPVTSLTQSCVTTMRRGHVVIRGTPDRLMLHLIEENSMIDPTYVEDFLLTHRTFINNSQNVAKQLVQWFENENTMPYQTTATPSEIRDRVTRVILLWVNNHFTDFETDTDMMELIELFESGLEKKNMLGQLRLLHIACAAKARQRNVTLARSSRDEDLHFTIIGGHDRYGYGVFISKVDKKTKPEDVGLKRGDQILEVNGQSFEHVTLNRAMELLMGTTHLSITVKSNLLAFKEMLQVTSDSSPKRYHPSNQQNTNRRRLCVSDIAKLQVNNTLTGTRDGGGGDDRSAPFAYRLSTVDLRSSGNMAFDQVDCCPSSSLYRTDLSSNNFSTKKDQPIMVSINNSPSSTVTSSVSSSITTSAINSSNSTITTGSTSGTANLTTPSSGAVLSASTTSSSHKGGFMTLGPKRRIQKALIKMNLLPKNSAIDAHDDHSDHHGEQQHRHHHSSGNIGLTSTGSTTLPLHLNSAASGCPGGISTNPNSNTSSNSNFSNSNNNNFSNVNTNNTCTSHYAIQHQYHHPNLQQAQQQQSQLYHSHSNPDLTTMFYEDNRATDYPEHVLKVYKSDQTCKYLLINKETTAHEVVMLALQEFGIHETSSNFSLCEVSVGDGGMIKQRRLPDQMQNLAERIGLCARYYLKTNGVTETLVPDDMAPDLIRESTVHFLQLNANELSIQLTFQDFAIFRQIESTEYVDDLFELKSKYGTPMLKQFAELVNREMFWVVTEVCSEHNMVRRMKIVKQFVKIARHCKECRNFNSMFAIISGLGHAAVSRLRLTWEKLPTKYQKLFADLQDLMDPSRNMSKYRQLVSAELLVQHPIIPFYPVVKKDLTFIHLGNDTKVENLINFEKLRMIAKEVRILTHMCSSTYDLLTMLEFKGQPPSSAMVALNQMSVSAGSHNLLHGGQATVKRRKKSTAAPNPKKMFEEAQMVRRVKAYLNNMKVITDEDMLHTLSLECEPSGSSGGGGGGGGGGGSSGGGGGGSGSAPNSVTIRKRHPSPTLSTTSSTSSTSEGKKSGLMGNNSSSVAGGNAGTTGPKFGTASPQAVKKILSLSEQTKTRPHQPRHPGIPLPLVGHTHSLHHSLHHPSISPSPSPGAHRRMGSSSSAGSVSYSAHSFAFPSSSTSTSASIGSASTTGRAVHERSHSDTPTPLPSVDLSVESSSVTSLSNMPLRKAITSGSVTSSDSGHGSCVQADNHSNCSEGSSGLYHVASSIVHNSPSPTLQQRRHSSIHGHGLMAPPPPKGRHPPAYSVAAQMARLHRLGRAHSHEGVTSSIAGVGNNLGPINMGLSPSGGMGIGLVGAAAASPTYYQPTDHGDEDDDEDAQVSAV